MSKLEKQMLSKPSNLPVFDLIAIHGIYDLPETVRSSINPPYSKSEIAVNEISGIVQVYVTSDNAAGLQAFRQDYPNADIVESAALENPDDWRVVAFTSEAMPDESTALDNYFQARGREYLEITEENLRKTREGRKNI